MLWATTRYHGHLIPIYRWKRADLDGASGATNWFHGKCEIALCEDLWKKGDSEVKRILLHEFVHVIEYMNDPGYLSPEEFDSCTMLAQQMEDGLTQLWGKFKLVKPCKVSRRKRKNSRSKSG